MIKTPDFPLKFDDTEGYANVPNTRAAVKFHLKNLLLTFPGEKVSDLTYGVGVQKFLFEPLIRETLNKIEDEIEFAIDEHLRYLSGVVVLVDEAGPNKINIKINYRIPHLGSDILDFNVAPQ
jgi:phage baseplate assembly protein W